MGGQTVYRDQLRGFAGQRIGFNHDAKTGKNDTGAVRQVATITVSTPQASYTFEVDVGGGPIAITGGDAASVTAGRDALLAVARANSSFEDAVAFNPSGADSITITSLVLGQAFTVTESDAQLTLVQTTANVAQVAIPFGRGVMFRVGSADPDSIQLPSSTGQAFQGVVERIHTVVGTENADADPASLQPLQAGTVVHKGQILVEIEDVTVGPDIAVFVRHTASGVNTELGRFRIDADTATADAVLTAKWADVVVGPGLAALSLSAA